MENHSICSFPFRGQWHEGRCLWAATVQSVFDTNVVSRSVALQNIFTASCGVHLRDLHHRKKMREGARIRQQNLSACCQRLCLVVLYQTPLATAVVSRDCVEKSSCSARQSESVPRNILFSLHSAEVPLIPEGTQPCTLLIPPNKHHWPSNLRLPHLPPNPPTPYIPFPNSHRIIPLMTHRNSVPLLIQTKLSRQIPSTRDNLHQTQRPIVKDLERR